MLFSTRYFTAPERSTNKGEHHGSVCTSGDALLPKEAAARNPDSTAEMR